MTLKVEFRSLYKKEKGNYVYICYECKTVKYTEVKFKELVCWCKGPKAIQYQTAPKMEFLGIVAEDGHTILKKGGY